MTSLCMLFSTRLHDPVTHQARGVGLNMPTLLSPTAIHQIPVLPLFGG